IDPPHVDRRLAVQGSHFVIFGRAQDMAQMRPARRKNCRLAKLVIAHNRFEEIEEELADCGITHSKIYPDLEALGKELDSFWKRRAIDPPKRSEKTKSR